MSDSPAPPSLAEKHSNQQNLVIKVYENAQGADYFPLLLHLASDWIKWHSLEYLAI